MAEKSHSSASVQATKKILLITNDEKFFEVDEPVAMEFRIIKELVSSNNDVTYDTLALPEVSAEPLSYIIEFCKAHAEFRAKRSPKDEVETFNAEFANSKSYDELKKMILAANVLGAKEILDLLIETVINMVTKKGVKDVKQVFGIETDLTPAEEEAARKEYERAFEGV